MNAQQFNELYEKRLDDLSSYMKTIHDDDARQEARIGIYEALKSDHDATDNYLLNRARWNQSNSRRKGRSVDNGFYKRDAIRIMHFDYMPLLDQAIYQLTLENRSTPIDDYVIDKICLENLLDELSAPELDVFNYKVLDEMTEKDVMQKLRVGRDRYKQIKSEIRKKFDEAFSYG
ncbi:hypothetical protein DESC_530021 [Desulfosarcina cetonica]|uniref:hypothetical protein n=1 Tax=Desulfosarcina cetonica TaxID=90730 RepID=UPI0006D15659|nr:hypothetical protein [Desulfosarcina cetonica]VTR66907.1 hypothetical protein DESC_530021 [Desulfosarcina cetonica]